MSNIIEHSGDCSIWIGPICDCGELRKAASDERSDDEGVIKDWCCHLAAIEREREPKLPA